MRIELVPPKPAEPEIQMTFTMDEARLLRNLFGHGGTEQWRAFIERGSRTNLSPGDLAFIANKIYMLLSKPEMHLCEF